MQAILQDHILQNWAALKEQQVQGVDQYNQKTLVDPTLEYLDETQQQHLEGLQPNITAVRLKSGPLLELARLLSRLHDSSNTYQYASSGYQKRSGGV